MERAYILETSPILRPESFPRELFTSGHTAPQISVDCSRPLEDVRKQAIEGIERRYLKELLVAHKGRIDTSAKAAGLNVRQFHNLMKKYGFRKEEFKLPCYRRHRAES